MITVKSFENYNPLTLLIFFIAALSVPMILRSPVYLISSLIMPFAFIMLCKKEELLKRLKYLLAVFVFTAAINPLFSHNGVTVLFFLNGNAVTQESLIYGVFAAVMLCSAILWLSAFSLVFCTEKIIYTFSFISPKIALVMSMSLRFIPWLLREWHRISDTQKILCTFYIKRQNRLRLNIDSAGALLSRALQCSVETASAMNARGYGGKKRSFHSDFSINSHDYALIALVVLLTLAVYIFKQDYYFYPALSGIQSGVRAAVSYLSCLLLQALPAIIKLKEAVYWKYSVSRI